jgi:hypothetical protein
MPQEEPVEQTYSPWTIVDVVFQHLVDQGLRPTFGQGGDPGASAGELLRGLGIKPTIEGDARIAANVQRQLAELRAAMDQAD